MSFIVPLIFVVFGSGSMIIISKRRFEEVLPVFLMCSILVVFLSGFLNQLLIGYYAAIALAAIFPISIIILLLKKKHLSDLRKRLLTPGFCIFIILYVFIYILNLNKGFIIWDEFSHWGPMVKEMLRLDKFYSVAESALSGHKDYPPAIPLFEALWCKLSGGYRESYLYTGLQILSLSLFFPALSGLNWRKNRNIFIKMILLVIVILSANIIIRVGEASFYQSIYIDCFLGLLFGYCMFLAIREKRIEKFGIFRLSVALTVLLLTKQMGLVFFLITLAAFAINQSIIHRNGCNSIARKKPTKQTIIRITALFICLLIVPMIFLFGWNTYTSALGIQGQFIISDIELSDLTGIITGNSGEAYQYIALENFARSLLKEGLFERPIILSYWQLMILAAVIYYLIGKYGRRYFEKYQFGGLTIVLCMGAIGYAFILLLLYLFSFSPYEAEKLASHVRYLSTYWFAVFALAIMLFLYITEKREADQNKSSVIPLVSVLIVSWLILLEPAAISNFIPSIQDQSVSSHYQEDADIIINHTEETDRIFIITQHDDRNIRNILKYLTLPRNYNSYYYSLGEPYNEKDIWTEDLSEEQWINEISKYDYLYLCEVDDQFTENYSGSFHSKNEIKNRQLFQIIHTPGGAIELSLIE